MACCSCYKTDEVTVNLAQSWGINDVHLLHGIVHLETQFFLFSIQMGETLGQRVDPYVLSEKLVQTLVFFMSGLLLVDLFEEEVQVVLLEFYVPSIAFVQELGKQLSSVPFEELLAMQTESEQLGVDVGVLVFEERLETLSLENHQVHVGCSLEKELPLLEKENFLVSNECALFEETEAEVVGEEDVLENEVLFGSHFVAHPLSGQEDQRALQLGGLERVFLHEEQLTSHDEDDLLGVVVFLPNYFSLLEKLGLQGRNYFSSEAFVENFEEETRKQFWVHFAEKLNFEVLIEVFEEVEVALQPPIADDSRLVIEILHYFLSDFRGELLSVCDELGLLLLSHEESFSVFRLSEKLGDEADGEGIEPNPEHHPEDRDDAFEGVRGVEVAVADSGKHHDRVIECREINVQVGV